MSGPDFDAFHERGKSLEDAFFAERDRQLTAALKQRLNADEQQRVLAYSLGLTDELAAKGIAHLSTGLEVTAIMALLPMVEVAWSDGTVESTEKAAVLRGAAEVGLEFESPLYKFLESWLDRRPSPAALDAWHSYVKSFVKLVDPATAMKVKDAVMGRSERVAKAAGGFLGFGNKISPAEQACLNDLAKTFDG
jgi:hypothetical protein